MRTFAPYEKDRYKIPIIHLHQQKYQNIIKTKN